LKPSILFDSGADMLVYGLGEKPVIDIIKALRNGNTWQEMRSIPQLAYRLSADEELVEHPEWGDVLLHSHETCQKSKLKFAQNFKHIEIESNMLIPSKRVVQYYHNEKVVVNPPNGALKEEEIDRAFDLPYTRLPHPKYKKRGSIPAFEMIKFSINMHRGCFGGCSFCTISAHQGKFISSRSERSILNEVDEIAKMPDYKGYISDLGGPSANMYRMQGIDLSICEKCLRPSCISPNVCYNLDTSHEKLLRLYRKVDAHPQVKKAFVGSGIRFDLLTSYNKGADAKTNEEYLKQLLGRHVSGRLKVAPEHSSDDTLKIMRKPSFRYFYEFQKKFETINKKLGLKLQLIPYFISSHPGSTVKDMADLAAQTKNMGFRLEQVQDFTPTPMTLATVVYYSGYHPYTLKEVYTAKKKNEKMNQHRFFFWYKKENFEWIKKQLKDYPALSRILLQRKEKKQNDKAVSVKNKFGSQMKNHPKRRRNR
jgi:uncharacterized radical SAM protein YgiQ